ncbi:hypothetical protein DTO012A8_5967 [Penicillium roqueforti]|nr:hypothetical protein DTO012A8_5967 [Penicillium roqueforti]
MQDLHSKMTMRMWTAYWPQLRYTATRLQCLLGRGVKGSSPFTNPSSLHHGFPDKLQHCNGSCWQDCLR